MCKILLRWRENFLLSNYSSLTIASSSRVGIASSGYVAKYGCSLKNLGCSSSLSLSLLHQLAKHSIIRAHKFLNIGIDRHFSARFMYTGHQDPTHTMNLPDLPLPGVALNNDSRLEWRKTLGKMLGVWTLSFGGLITLALYVKSYLSEPH